MAYKLLLLYVDANEAAVPLDSWTINLGPSVTSYNLSHSAVRYVIMTEVVEELQRHKIAHPEQEELQQDG